MTNNQTQNRIFKNLENLNVEGYGKGKVVGYVSNGQSVRVEFESGEVKDFHPVKLEAKLITEPREKTYYQKWNEGDLTGLGSFHTSLMQTYRLADESNQKALQKAFPGFFLSKEEQEDLVEMGRIIKREDIYNLMVTALEGGSNYWYDIPTTATTIEIGRRYMLEPGSLAVTNGAFDGFEIDVHSMEEFDRRGKISLENFSRAEELMIKHHPRALADIISGDFDQLTADIWFQLVVFGEVIYG